MFAVTSADAAGSALTASTTCLAVLVIAPEAFVARLTTMSLPLTATDSGEEAAFGLTSAAVMSLPPSLP